MAKLLWQQTISGNVDVVSILDPFLQWTTAEMDK